MIRAILCEDDVSQMKINKELIKTAIRQQGEKVAIRTFEKTEDVKEEDIIWANTAFLDINLGEEYKNGVQFASDITKINKMIAIIFITSYQEYTAEAFKVKAFGYLEKPILKRELIDYTERLVKYLHEDSGFIEVFENHLQITINIDKIMYIEKIIRKVIIHTVEREVCVNESITALQEKTCFLKINQGILVNKDYIQRIEGDIIYINTGKGLKVARKRVKDIVQALSKGGE